MQWDNSSKVEAGDKELHSIPGSLLCTMPAGQALQSKDVT